MKTQIIINLEKTLTDVKSMYDIDCDVKLSVGDIIELPITYYFDNPDPEDFKNNPVLKKVIGRYNLKVNKVIISLEELKCEALQVCYCEFTPTEMYNIINTIKSEKNYNNLKLD